MDLTRIAKESNNSNMTYKCLIVDDEKLGRELIASYVSYFPQLEVAATCASAFEAIQLLAQQSIDILFLDINMPNINGIELLEQQTNRPLTILCTAYSEYALQSYELDVVDYLLKPIDLARFSKAITKALARLGAMTNTPPPSPTKTSTSDYFFVKSEHKKIKINIAQIDYIKAMEKYVRIYLGKEKVLTLMSMSQILKQLPESQFYRIHRSYIINKNRIEEIQGNMVVMKGKHFPVSRANRHLLQELLG